jgi:hypothetical protein
MVVRNLARAVLGGIKKTIRPRSGRRAWHGNQTVKAPLPREVTHPTRYRNHLSKGSYARPTGNFGQVSTPRVSGQRPKYSYGKNPSSPKAEWTSKIPRKIRGAAAAVGTGVEKSAMFLSTGKGQLAATGAAALGVYGVSHSRNIEQYYRSQYGEEEGGKAALGIQRVGSAATLAILGVGGLGVLGNKGRARTKKAIKVGWGATKTGAKVGVITGLLGLGVALVNRKGRIRHPFLAAFGLGFWGAAAAGVGNAAARKRQDAPEGKITGIYSGPGGGRYAPLQFSTQGLPQRIHNNRRRASL